LRQEFGAGIRVAPYRKYLIFYSVQGSTVLIEHIRHGARNLEGVRL
jgi:plasmid stabilization system protein ParE